MQFLEPALNGTKANGFELRFSERNLSGLNASGFSQIDSILPIIKAAISKFVPFGMNFPSKVNDTAVDWKIESRNGTHPY